MMPRIRGLHLPTEVYEMARAMFQHGNFFWNADHQDWGEGDFLIQGETDYGSFGDCYWEM
jgi:hypothetical protein